MIIYIAKHYWKDNENATWKSHEKIDKNLLEYLKSDYHNFTRNRPSMINEHGYFVYFCYEDKRDIYDRSITNVTFFISKKSVPNNFCNSSIANNLELIIEEKSKLPLIITGVIVLSIFSYITLFDKSSSQEDNIKGTNIKSTKQIEANLSNTIQKNTERKPIDDIQKVKEEKYNQKIVEYLQDKFPVKVENKKDFDNLMNILNELKTFKKNSLTSHKNIGKIEILSSKVEELRTEYTQVLMDDFCGYITIEVPRDAETYSIKRLVLNDEDCKKKEDYYVCNIKQNSKIHLVQTKFLAEKKIINKSGIINENKIIEIYNSSEPIKVEIKNGYYLNIMKENKGKCSVKR